MKYTIAFLLVFVVVWLILRYPPGGERKNLPRPSIYVTRTDHVRTIEGKDVWIIEYTINGEFSSAAFDSREGMIRYREYLDTIGTVYRRDGEDAGEGGNG